MTFLTAGDNFFRVRGMTLRALRDHAVDTMAGGTFEAAVSAFTLPELLGLKHMAVKAASVVE